MSSLGSLAKATDKNVAELDALQDSVQRDTAAVQDLLVKEEAARKVEAIKKKEKKRPFFSQHWGNLHITATIH